MWVSEEKRRYFEQGGSPWLNPTPEWKRQFQLCDCLTCFDRDCKARDKSSRFPCDSGGDGQCLRLAQAESDFAFRNVDGRVIVLPEEIVNKIIACLP